MLSRSRPKPKLCFPNPAAGMTTLPKLQYSRCPTLIRAPKVDANEAPLKLVIGHGKRSFKVTLRLAQNENGSRISMRHLAEVVMHETGIVPREQRFYFRGYQWSNPDLGPWSPGLRDLGLKNGDRIQLVAFHHSVPDWEATERQDGLEKRFRTLKDEVHALFYRIHGVHQGFVETGNQLMALSSIKQSLDTVKEKLMVLIKDLNELNLDHRNFEGQARRRETVDCAQRQLDKCVDASTTIFHKLAQSQQLSHNGPLFAGDPMLASSRSWRNSKRAN